MKIINVVGARPNFVKIAPLVREMAKHEQINELLVHTGQHYDDAMSQDFFDELRISKPDIHLEIGSGSHAEQTAGVMIEFEKTLKKESPDLVVVVGDVNSTMACAIAATKLNIHVAHVEAGLRSRDMTMPEEVNRMVTDTISDLLFATSEQGVLNLQKEGVSEQRIHLVGNIMIDTLMSQRAVAEALTTYESMGVGKGDYALVTMHRPKNVDDAATLESMLGILQKVGEKIPIVFPAHPRTMARIKEFGLSSLVSQKPGDGPVFCCGPVKYTELMNLQMNAKLVLTDSGGIQEETTVLGVPCLTMRDNTERPETVAVGTNVIVGRDEARILENVAAVLAGTFKRGSVPPLWDGHTAERIVSVLLGSGL